MDNIEQTYGINANRSICVAGLTKTDTDDDIIASLKTYGVVAKVVRLPSTEREDDSTVIVEFTSETPMAVLELNLPFEIPSTNDTSVTCYVIIMLCYVILYLSPWGNLSWAYTLFLRRDNTDNKEALT